MAKRLFLYKTAKVLVATLVLAACLFGDSVVFQSNALVGAILGKTLFIFYDSGMQWVVFLCLGFYFVIFALLPFFQTDVHFYQPVNRRLWLIGGISIGAVVYGLHYSTWTRSTEALTLLGGATLGQSVAAWRAWPTRRDARRNTARLVMVVLLLLLTVSSGWHATTGQVFQYHGQVRWSGPWASPNLYGLLMALGLVIACGIAISDFKFRTKHVPHCPTLKSTPCRMWLWFVLYAIAMVATGMGLMKSYSRGAWLGTLCGLAYLTGFWFQGLWSGGCEEQPVSTSEIGNRKSEVSCPSCVSWFKNNWFLAGVVFLSVVVLSFWHFRQTDSHPARRAFSAVNMGDFSWRNRVAAWQGALQITAEHPWFGAGWNQPEPLYEHYYLSPK
jgi:O-antigen ligase